MRPDRAPPKTLAATAQNLSRILIASYFMAVALNLVGGTTGHNLALWVVPQEHAGTVASTVIFGLAFMVMIGVWLRPAALLLAIVLFWSSFITIVGPNVMTSLDGFWRDLALIGALFLTYAQSGRAARLRSIIRRRHRVRKLGAGTAPTPRRITPTVNSAPAARLAPMPEAASPTVMVPRLVVPEVDLQPVPVPQFRSHRTYQTTAHGPDNIFREQPAKAASA